MKICYLAPANNPHTIKWCKYFKLKGHDIHLISFVPGEIEGIHIHNIVFEKGIENKNYFSKLKYLLQINKIKKIIKDIEPDIIHAHYATSYGIIGALSNSHPYVLSVWGSDVYDFPQISPIHKQFIKFNLKKADYILSTSKDMKKETEKYTDKSIEVTPFGVDIYKFKPLPGLKDHKQFVIGTVKTLKPKYGIEYLIKAFKILKDKFPQENLKLKIAGKGEQEEELKNLCEDLQIQQDVEFLGFLSEDEVIGTFNTFDVAVFPSVLDSESFGVAAVEAQACGLPVIISNVGGLPEATSPNNTSLVVEKKNEKELAKALEKIMVDENLRQTLSTNARDFVLKNYNIEDNFRKVELLYERIVKTNNK